MTTENERELAQLERTAEVDQGDRRLFVAVLVDDNAHGLAYRGLRLATAEDVLASPEGQRLRAQLEGCLQALESLGYPSSAEWLRGWVGLPEKVEGGTND